MTFTSSAPHFGSGKRRRQLRIGVPVPNREWDLETVSTVYVQPGFDVLGRFYDVRTPTRTLLPQQRPHVVQKTEGLVHYGTVPDFSLLDPGAGHR